MSHLIPVKYGRCTYPAGILPQLTEIAGHFDSKPVAIETPFSLHTEYSYAHRSFSSPALQGLDTIREAQRASIPRLWYSTAWAEDFASFVLHTVGNHTPTVIEVHPPFDDYASLSSFLERYAYFEAAITARFPDVVLLVENRSGTLYRGGNFVLSTAEQLTQFSGLLDASDLRLRITLDIPQLFTAHNAKRSDIDRLLDTMRSIRHNIAGIHLWGKRKNASGKRVAHCGDLTSYFYDKAETKALFLSALVRFLDDERPRYFVPEVNSGQADFLSIITDLLSAGVQFK